MKSFTFLFFLLMLTGCAQDKSMPITEYLEQADPGDLLIDVRTPGEYDRGHLENSVNINIMGNDFLQHFDTIDKEKTLYIYCQKGGRSARAVKILDSLGFRAIDLTGGYQAIQQ